MLVSPLRTLEGKVGHGVRYRRYVSDICIASMLGLWVRLPLPVSASGTWGILIISGGDMNFAGVSGIVYAEFPTSLAIPSLEQGEVKLRTYYV